MGQRLLLFALMAMPVLALLVPGWCLPQTTYAVQGHPLTLVGAFVVMRLNPI